MMRMSCICMTLFMAECVGMYNTKTVSNNFLASSDADIPFPKPSSMQLCVEGFSARERRHVETAVTRLPVLALLHACQNALAEVASNTRQTRPRRAMK